VFTASLMPEDTGSLCSRTVVSCAAICLGAHLIRTQEIYHGYETALKAFADDTRMALLELLLRHNYCVRALANELKLTEATISQHRKFLHEA
jgi:hypothetical protein